jgi:peptidoglycan/LPS O-acetylase OafA/YrhL
LFLLHNFTRPWSLAVDSPMWSVAVESQIYILFPLILLPVWRRFGMFAAVFSGFLVGLLPVLLLPHGTNFDTSCPWFVGIFAVGTAAACLAVSQKSDGLFSRPRAWAVTAILLFAAVILVQTRVPRLWNRLDLWHKDLLNALCVGALLVFLARSQLHPGARQSLLARVLSSKAFVTLGAFSYSLYLIHRPIIDLLEMMLPAHLQPKVHILALFALGLPTCLVTAYLFYLPFERNGLLGNYVISLATARRERRPVSPKSNSAQKAMMPLNGALGIEDETPATTGR